MQYHAKQIECLDALSKYSPVQQVLYGGSAGSGKSFLGCDWMLKRVLKYPNTRGLIGRAELKKLRLSTMATFWNLCAQYGIKPQEHYTYNGQDHVIKFYNGSEIILMDLADLPSDVDFARFGSLEISYYFVDEVAEVSKRCIDILDSRVRYNLVNGIPKGLMTCNPSKGWIYNDFYLASKNNELREDRAFIQALPTDNPHLPEIYLDKLRKLPEYDRKRLLEGNWEYDDDTDKLFATDNLLRCFRNEVFEGTKYITADIARFGADRTIICLWNGMSLTQIYELKRASLDEVAAKIKEVQMANGVLLKNIVADEDGIGAGVTDFLKCQGFRNGSKPISPNFMNLKAECYFKLAQIIEEGKMTFLTNQYKDTIVRELEMIKRHKADSDGKLQVTPKEIIKQREGISPDYADAIMMRMFYELYPNYAKYAMV